MSAAVFIPILSDPHTGVAHWPPPMPPWWVLVLLGFAAGVALAGLSR